MTRAAIACLIAAATACGDDEGPVRSIAELQDPQTCNECHAKHVTQWSASMHAYASDDPVFVAMNKRGQRETNGALGTFCVKCHAPMAVELGLTNGIDFDPAQLPTAARGVTCYFCHNVKAVADVHNNGLVVAHDQTMRGGVAKPVSSPAHHSAYDKLMDSTLNQSEVCGSCHDVVTPRGVALERTYQEWQTTFFSDADPLHHLTCGSCHMASSTDVIADAPGLAVKSRSNGFHEHLWPAIDQVLTPFPGDDMMAAGIKRELDPAIAIIGPASLTTNIQYGGLCLDMPGYLFVRIDSISVAHNWPSGAAQDRRAWLEVVAYSSTTDDPSKIVFQSGVVPDGVDPEDINDPQLVKLWDIATKGDGSPAHFFWDIAAIDGSNTLRPPITLDKNVQAFDHSRRAMLTIGDSYKTIDHINARIRIRPLAYAMLDDLVSSGDLAPTIASQLRTLDILGTQRGWDRRTKGMGPAMFTNCSPQ